MNFILRVVWTPVRTAPARCFTISNQTGVTYSYWVMTQAFWLAALKTDGPITGNITGSCRNRYSRIRHDPVTVVSHARSISNKKLLV